MLHLKPNCTTLKFSNLVINEESIRTLLYGAPSPEKATEQIASLQDACVLSPEYAEDYKSQMCALERLIADPNYKEGKYPRGIENIIQQIIEPISLWEAISELENGHFLASENYFKSLIDVAITFLLSSEIAKLFNFKEEDFSLCNVWRECKSLALAQGLTTEGEVDYIDDQFDVKRNLREARIKRVLQFRNKQIAHNSSSDAIDKSDLIYTIRFILRVWAILDSIYCSNYLPRPILMDENVFAHFHKIMSAEEIKRVKAERSKFINELINACSLDLVTGEKDEKRPFGELKITFDLKMIE